MSGHEHPFALTGEQVHQFDDQGFLVLRGQLPHEALNGLERAFSLAVDRLARAWHEAGYIDDVHADLEFDARFRELHASFDQRLPGAWRRILVTPEVYGMWRRPELLGPIRSLMGDEVYAHGIWNGRPRLPGLHREQVLWHQDAHYYRGWDPADGRLISAWMPLVPVDRSSSCLEFVVGSPRLGRVERRRAQTGLFTVPAEVLEGQDTVAAEMVPGDVVLFSDTTLHQSTLNVSDRVRWSLDIRFGAATPALMGKSARGYHCHSAHDPDQVESFETWAARYQHRPEELADELENFAGMDTEQVRDLLARTPERLDVY